MTIASGLDRELVEELKGIMGEEFDLLVNTFLKDSEKRIEALQYAIEHNDADSVREQAHSLKGSSSNLGAALLSELCRQLEMTGRSHALEDSPALLEKIRTEFAEVQQALS